MNVLVSEKEMYLFSRVDEAVGMMRGTIIAKNEEIARLQEENRKLKAENEFIVKRLEDLEREANKGAYL